MPAKNRRKPPAGTGRSGSKRPVVAAVTDADAKRTFLFLDAQREGKPAFFELSDEPRLVEYDPKLVPLPPAAEPNRTMLHRARILVALKKIEGKLPAKEKP